MRIFNEEKTKELNEEDIDYSIGYMINDKIVHKIKEQQYVEEISHLEIDKKFDNGSVTYKRIIDKPEIPYIPEHDEIEPILVFKKYTILEIDKIKAQASIDKINKWFENYDIQCKQYERCMRLGIAFDKNMQELDNEAIKNAEKLKNLQKFVDNN